MAADDEKQKDDINWRQALMTVGLAFAIPWMIGIPAYLGYLADNHYNTTPRWFIVGLILGLLSAIVDIYKLLKRFGQFK
jgi:F0F1-type ATP synthase assembly protein I